MRVHRTVSHVSLALGALLLFAAVLQFGCAGEYWVAKPANNPPTIESLTVVSPPSQVKPTVAGQGDVLEYVVSASDPEGDPISYLWSASCGTMVGGAAGRAMWRATVPPGTSCTVTVVVSDDKGASSSASDNVEIKRRASGS